MGTGQNYQTNALLSLDMIYENILKMNEDYRITYFEFLNDPENWNNILQLLANDNIFIKPVAEIKNECPHDFDFLLSTLFQEDYKRIFNKQYLESISTTPLYNIDFRSNSRFSKNSTSNKTFTYFIEDDSYVFNRYNHKIKQGFGDFEFIIKHNLGATNFEVDIKLSHEYIKKPYKKMSKQEKESYSQYYDVLNMRSQMVPINKTDMANFIADFIKNINTLDITENYIAKIIRANQNDSCTAQFLEYYSTIDKIEKNTKPPILTNYDKSHNRAYFDYLQAYTMFLAEDIHDYFKTLQVIDEFHKIKIDFEYKKNDNLNYHIDISEQKVCFYQGENLKSEWHHIESHPNIHFDIVEILENDFKDYLKSHPEIEHSFYNNVQKIINEHYPEHDISINIPDFLMINTSQIMKEEIPFIFSHGEDKIKIIIKQKENEEWFKDKEFTSFMEKIKIKTALNIDTHSARCKKRI